VEVPATATFVLADDHDPIAHVRAADGLATAVRAARRGARVAVLTAEDGADPGATLKELLALAAPRQVIVSDATAALAGDRTPTGTELVDWGVHAIGSRDRCRVWCLAGPSLSMTATRPGNLPSPLTSFVGRPRELAAVADLVARTRIVTLTGAGGCGKTRLALEAARRVQPQLGAGAWFVDVTPLTAGALVTASVASVLGVREQRGMSIEDAVALHLGDTHTLIVLDNCEHLVSACAVLARSLLQACPGVTILATSREPLGVEGEHTVPVPPLEVDEAVALFSERGAAARPQFSVTNDNRSAVQDICAQLDGIPLAIELAAARVRVLSVEQILSGLDDRFRLLGGGAAAALPRHQTLAASVVWSHDLLTEPERVLLRRLAVFSGGFHLDAAEAVAADDAFPAVAILELLAQLVTKSLVQADGDGRYTMLETIRQFAIEQLVAAGEVELVRDRHLGFFRGALTRGAPPDVEQDNLRAALGWAMSNSCATVRLDLVTAIAPYWHRWTREAERVRWLELATADGTGAPPALLGHALRSLALAHILNDAATSDVAEAIANRAVVLARETDDDEALAAALLVLSRILSGQGRRVEAQDAVAGLVGPDALATMSGFALMVGDLATCCALGETGAAAAAAAGNDHDQIRALVWHAIGRIRLGDLSLGRALASEAVALAQARNDAWGLVLGNLMLSFGDGTAGDSVAAAQHAADALEAVERHDVWAFTSAVHHVQGLAAYSGGELGASRTWHEQAVTEADAVGYNEFLATFLAGLGETALAQGDIAVAAAALSRGEEVARADGDDFTRARTARGLARVAIADNDPVRADSLAHEALALFAQCGARVEVAETLDVLAGLLVRTRPLDAARLLGAAEGVRAEAGAVVPAPLVESAANIHAAAQNGLGDDAYAAAVAEGAAMSWRDAVAYATRGRGPRARPVTGWRSLTRAESEVASLVAIGLSNQEIADRLFVSTNTVKTHLSHVYAKLQTHSRSGVAAEVTRQTG
jgi:predicted ATPase/DNA-binding CsgD family transcriptional regulator